ncbi:hypothetical protein [Streptomyces sp. NBC_00316]|uniref:hypothetical protein n=1 Tax=Streptomyces sp. NBC_00316 TaxID=2975710 RepID=UPI002E28E943|nr:hypothetical protein [Streptomyces sp. NBC_00316]
MTKEEKVFTCCGDSAREHVRRHVGPNRLIKAHVAPLAGIGGPSMPHLASMRHSEVRDAIHHLCDVAEALTARARAQRAVRRGFTGTDIVLPLGGIPLPAAQP